MRVIIYVILTFAIVLASFSQATGCSCLPIETFCKEIDRAKSNDWDRFAVVRGTIVEEIFVNEYRTDRIFTVSESFINPLSFDRFRVQEGNGADCGRFLGDYEIGDELIVIVYFWNDSTPVTHFSECSPAPLRVKGNRVTGEITEHEEQTMTLATFRRLPSCQLSSLSVSIFPNPTSEKINIQRKGSQDRPSFLEIEVFDLLGRIIYRHQLPSKELNESNFQLDTSSWPEGTYILLLKDGQQVVSRSISVTHP